MTGRDCRRGDVVLVALDPTKDHELSKTRPCIVVRNDLAKAAPVVIVVPVQNAEERQFKFFATLKAGDGGLSKDSFANAMHIRSIAESRIIRKLGTLSADAMSGVEAALKFVLDLSED